jgi:hypothetical protein
MSARDQTRINIFFAGSREELDKIESTFQWLKWEFGIRKTELYKKALLWIATDEKARAKFMEYLSGVEEVAQTWIIKTEL